MTCFWTSRCLPGDDVTAPCLGVKSCQKNCIWGVNRHFQSKHVKYQHLHIIKTTASIPSFQPNFAQWQIPPNTRHGWSNNKSKMVDSRHYEQKFKNCLWLYLLKFLVGYYILRWVVDDAKCILFMRVCESVCVSVCLSAAVCPHYCTDPK